MQPSIFSLVSLLLAGTSFTGFVGAFPTQVEDGVQSRNSSMNVLDARGLSLKVGSYPETPADCPETNNPGFQRKDAHTYTTNQIKAAYVTGARLAAEGKTLGANKYPHDFGNNELLPFPCGSNKMEFVIQDNGHIYNGENARELPDRVVFEYNESKTEFLVKFCGVMRHGPNQDFLDCPNN
ncbi:Ribonuclease/ribotoxin [Xylaria castorea]|nr:Ribonuclease/ribotoxin [Xylaria castorea]